jgi:hypothetical protein
MNAANAATTPAGGSFLREAPDPQSVFIPEEFDPEARLMAEAADDFLRREVLPRTEQIEAHDTALMDRLMRQAGALGLLGAEVPEVYGGLGLDNRTGALLAEKLNWQQSFALTHEAHTVIATFPLMYFGSDALKRKYLPKLATGEAIGSFCLSEPGSGSDALGAQTRATRTEDGWTLNGTKMWITNAAFADLFTVFAKVDGEQFSCFMVERDTPGLSFGKEEHKLGMRGTSTRRVVLENVTVPAENLVGEVGKGHYAAFTALNMGRFKLEAGAVGGIKETLAVCAAYAKQRRQFGKALAEFGLVQAKLGEICARLFGLESAVYRLAGLLDGLFDGIDAAADDAPARYHRAAEEYAIECGVVKVIGSELYSWATDEGIQIHGGYGYTEEFPVARAWRDQRLLRIGEGANEVVRVNIVSTLLRRVKQGRLELPASGAPGDGLKPLALALLEAARGCYGEALLEEQEVVAAVADLVCAAFVEESARVRAFRLRDRCDGRAATLAEKAATACAEGARQSLLGSTETALARLRAAGADVRGAEAALAALHAGPSADLIGLRRELAAAVLERERYPWS